MPKKAYNHHFSPERIAFYGSGSGSPTGWIVPATASPATTLISALVINARTPEPRSASAVALTCTCPSVPAGETLQIVESVGSTATVATSSFEDCQLTSPSTLAGLPAEST